MITKQELFDRVIKGLSAQGWQRSTVVVNNVEVCRYRIEDGRRCAAGHLISDDQYDFRMEGSAIETVIARFSLSELYGHENFLLDLQRLHDSTSNVLTLKERFEDYAEKNNLVFGEADDTVL